MLLNNFANAKVRKYREAYAAPDRLLAFLPAIMSTSDRIHGEFLRLLHILSHQQAINFCELFGEEPTDNAFTFRRVFNAVPNLCRVLIVDGLYWKPAKAKLKWEGEIGSS